MTRPALTDRDALSRARARAARAPALFLHEFARDELQERLTAVNRAFTAPAVVTPFADVWRGAVPGARIVPDAPVLDLEAGAHDLVIHALALHWEDDPVGQIVQCRHALRPDGLFLAVLFGGRTLWQLRTALAEAEVALTGGLSPRVLPMGDLRDLGGLVQRAGLAMPVADCLPVDVAYADLFALLRDLRGMGETNALAARHRRTPPRALFPAAAALYADRFPAEGGRIAARFDLVFLAGWAPAESQPKPLRPGSAAARLADALGAVERPAGDAVPQRRPDVPHPPAD